MVSGNLNELIWHFIGYLRLDADIATNKAHYQKAENTQNSIEFNLPDVQTEEQFLNEFKVGSSIPQQLSSEATEVKIADNFQRPILPPQPSLDEIVSGVDIPPVLKADPVPVVPDDNATPSDFTISFFYRVTGSQSQIFEVKSGNTLVDNDQLIDTSITLNPETGAVVSDLLTLAEETRPDAEAIEDALELAQAQIPDFIDLEESDPELLAEQLAEAFAARVHCVQEMMNTEMGPCETVPSGSVATSPIPPAGSEYVSQVSSPIPSNEEGQDDNPEGPALAEEADFPSTEMSQTVHLGSNEAINVASIVDTSEATSAMIILGDYYESNAVIQTNIYSFDDNENIGTTVVDGEVIDGTNAVINTVDLTDQEFDELIPAPTGFSLPGYTFSVDYVVGDFYDINIVTQHNDLTDNDTVVYETHTEEYLIETGDNSLVNATQILDLHQEYDMVIVEGSYNEINLIKQTNIVFDVDPVQFGSGFGDVIIDNNVLENDAVIHNYGDGELFQPLTEDVEELATSVANFEEDLSYTNAEMDFGMPANLSSEVNVLYISGDFFQLNAIDQTNIISDVDGGLLLAEDPDIIGISQTVDVEDGVAKSKPDKPGQAKKGDKPGKKEDDVFATGDNLAKNEASIVDYDSQSEFQYLDGDFYEQDLLIQVNLVVPEEDLPKGNGNQPEFVNELVAFTDEMHGPGQGHGKNSDHPVFDTTPELSESAEMLGGMMA